MTIGKKQIEAFIMILLIFTLSITGCTFNKEDKLIEEVKNYYEKFEPMNKGETKIFAIKPFNKQYLILSEKYFGDGQAFTDLFLIDEKYKVVKKAQGHEPISMCFTVNRLDYEGKTILFGNFNDSKWLIVPDKRQKVNIDKIFVEFENGEKYEEIVSMDKGFIIISNTISGVKNVNLYNNKGELQSNLDDIGGIIEDATFI